MHEDPVDRYLAGVERQLAALPTARREEDLRELRQHLDLLVAGHRAAGLDARAAAEAAVERFGQAGRIGRGLRDAARPRRSIRSYAAFYACFAAVQLAVNLLVLVLVGERPDLRDPPLGLLWPALALAAIVPAVLVLADLRRHRAAAAGTGP